MNEELGIPSGWRIYELGARDDYFAIWNSIRERAPVIDAGEGVFLVSGWELVNGALRNPALKAGAGVSESFGGMGGPVESVVRNWLMSLNGEEHRQARGLVSRLFAPRALLEVEPVIRGVVKTLVAAFVEKARNGAADFAADIALKLPAEVARRLFAVEPAEWAAHVEPLFAAEPSPDRDAFAAVQGLTPYFQDKVQASRGRRIGGLIDRLRAEDREGDCLSEAEVIANSVLIVTAAIDTTAGLISNTLYCLLEHPESLARAQADPAAIPGVVDESLRYCPSAPSSTRSTAVALELGGQEIPAGSHLFFSLAAANRDPRKFADPDRFDIGRDASALLTFGGGAHFCLGAGLARMEARIVFEELFAAASDFALAAPVRWRIDNPTVRAPQKLMISCLGR